VSRAHPPGSAVCDETLPIRSVPAISSFQLKFFSVKAREVNDGFSAPGVKIRL
jgi:hypothetical protein